MLKDFFVVILIILIVTSAFVLYTTKRKYVGGSSLKALLYQIGKRYTPTHKYVDLAYEEITKKHSPKIKMTDLKHRLPYKNDTQLLKPQFHNGQRKLFLSEVQFLTNTTAKYCIYAGAAPGNKTHYLSTLFPHIKFILIDPNKFNLILPNKKSHRKYKHKDIVHLKSGYGTLSNEVHIPTNEYVSFIKSSGYKIFIIEDFMNDEYANLFKSLNHTFISDIRSNINADTINPTDLDILWNMSMMFNWIYILRPEVSMLKFRQIYYNEKINLNSNKELDTSKKYGIDFLDDYKRKRIIMPAAEFYLQAWAGKTSSELRMVIQRKDITNFKEYSSSDIDDALFYFNNVNRGLTYHTNKNSSKKYNFCHCNDCALENNIWENYIKKYNIKGKKVIEYVTHLSKITFRSLNRVHKNTIFTIPTTYTLNKFLKQENVDRLKRIEANKKKKKKIARGNSGQ